MGTSAHADRRHTPRRSFRGNVELAIADDAEGYEADGVDVSIGGMALKTSFLPDVGSELEARFSLEDGAPVVARGEVVWALDAGAEAGQFGLRFTDLGTSDEQAILNSFKKSPPPREKAPRESRDARPPQGQGGADENRARLHIRGMEAPLRARVRTQMDDVIVLGSDLSFLKLGDRVEVERNGDRVGGNIEDVSVEVDGQTRVARLVLTVATGAAPPAPNALPDEAPRGPSALEARRGPSTASPAQPIAPAPAPTIAARVAETTAPRSQPASRPAQATAVLTPDPVIAPTAALPEITHDDDEEIDQPDAEASEPPEAEISASPEPRKPAAPRGCNAPPAWLVTALASLRAAGAWGKRATGPALARVLPLLLALGNRVAVLVRTRVLRKPAETAPAAPARGGSSVALRKQQPGTQASPAAAPAARAVASARKKYGLYALAGLGAAALVFAIVLQQKEPPPATPHPQVAVAGAEATAEPAAVPGADPNAVAANGAAPGADPNAANANANANANAVAPGGDVAPEGEDPTAAAPQAPAVAPAPRAPRAMPTDLVAAARSRNADVNEDMPTITSAPGRASASRNSAPAPAPVASNNAATAHAGARVIGNSALRGNVLRLHMDGPIAGITGAAGGNALTIHLAGRRSLDLAAPLVRQDARLVNAGVRNRAAGAEVTLRFRDAVPVYSARARGDVLEIVLAPAAAAAHHAQPAAAAPAHPTAAAHPAPAARAGATHPVAVASAHPAASAHAAPAPAHRVAVRR